MLFNRKFFMSKREIKLLINDMLDSAAKILAYSKGMSYEQFLADNKTKDAVVRNFEIIGEAANRLPEAFRLARHKIDWQRIRDFATELYMSILGSTISLSGTSKKNTCQC